jgi:hypothetical protein
VSLTKSSFPFPLSFTVNGNDVSNPVSMSLTRRRAWCGRFGVLPSTAVRTILRLSDAPSAIGFDKGALIESLGSMQYISRYSRTRGGAWRCADRSLPVFKSTTSSLSMHGHSGLRKTP